MGARQAVCLPVRSLTGSNVRMGMVVIWEQTKRYRANDEG
jgi:hypothetical protein